eukprot:15485513-Alexandrium_andersonii.AAC.1
MSGILTRSTVFKLEHELEIGTRSSNKNAVFKSYGDLKCRRRSYFMIGHGCKSANLNLRAAVLCLTRKTGELR